MCMAESHIHQQCLQSLCSTMPLQYVYTDANRPEKKKDRALKSMYIAWISFL